MAIPIEKFQQQGGRLDLDGIDFDQFVTNPLDPNVLRVLSYMHDIEYQTVLYTRELLLLPQWADPQFTAFLTLWNYEEYWHGQAIGQVLAMHERPAHDERLTAMREWNRKGLTRSPLTFWALGRFVRQFPAVHMTWGSINEWTANAAYNRLAQIADHPVLTELLGRIMRQEGRHAGYYASYARDLLSDNVRAQKVTKWFLNHEWAPVGSGDVPEIETSFATAFLFGSGEGMHLVDLIEERIDALPGLSGLNLVRDAIAASRRHVLAEEGRLPTPRDEQIVLDQAAADQAAEVTVDQRLSASQIA